ncbi:MAG: putative bifunctional diguanylate cyclase/phosphodiesterase [Acidimicrobiia bacterium]
MSFGHPAVQARRFASVVEGTTDVVVMVAPNGQPFFVNAAARELLDLGADDPLPSELDLLTYVPSWVRPVVIDEIAPLITVGGTWSGELAVRCPDGTEVPMSVVVMVHLDRHGQVEYIAATGRDISERKGFERRLAHQATHDALTGLPNRVLLLDRLAMAMARRQHGTLAVLFCDLDQFKVVNDSLGHDVGDRLLAIVAHRIVGVVRPQDTVARFGGDEFVIMCDELTAADDAMMIASRIAQALTDPIHVDNHDLAVATSVGIAFQRADHQRPEDLIRDADAAMYRAKERGRNRVEVFSDELRAKALIRLDTERALRRAIERRELRVFYQPKIDLAHGDLCGFEALVRWNHPERGLLLPGDFIALAEETGLIVPIGTWVLTEACSQLERWRRRYRIGASLDLSVNLSARQLNQPDIVDTIAGALEVSGLSPARLVLEMTESVLMADAAENVHLLRSLKALGVRLAVDDFGTGYSSLAYLRRFPVDVVKIDRAFVAGIGRNNDDTEIVRLVTTLARTLRLQAVAEGVETRVQLDNLRDMGCDRAQGFYLYPPLAAAAAEGLLSQMGVGRSSA